ncbi:MAG: neutral/alkaline non-lysosomal ceramidase N-terminal domain-containing protein [Gemmatales bacterium]|nr:neutral/alkaline non-lysosomal ceramidase N-terminal domain-containing protein [Gemmatales bacterium]MCS7161542.1 neutral/alkaline non-lysosomal ceramidase N-terminal domain-containing protein [Gemmatales bacterium]MDW8176745.1 neutral/alkaline non-lysosomal ceramidase N-terminal domain-containing protein [Gemmatales bacterium]MDW8222031.1 neutral/alkaline non-lysosomal ceramidase N-terminal domain-containing protein [Gemmatales bacterium]
MPRVRVAVAMLLIPLVVLLAFASSRPHLAAQKPRSLSAGAYASDITPRKFPVSVNGHMTDRQVSEVHDPLRARCLVLDDGKTTVAFVIVDSCMIPRDLCDRAKELIQKKTGIPARNVLIAATHTHSAVTLTGAFQSEPVEWYREFVVEQIVHGVERAWQQREPAQVAWGVGEDATQVFNRRWFMKPGTIQPNPFGQVDQVRMNPGYQHPGLIKPAGPTDPQIGFLSVQARDGRPIAFLANYALHYVGGVPGLSADYFGAFAERIQQLLGAEKVHPPFVGIMSNGASGDINNINYAGPAPGKRAPYEQCRLVADSVARKVFAAYQQVAQHHRADVSLAVAEQEIELGVRLPSEADLARAQQILAQARGPVLTTLPEIYARETVLLARYPPTVRLKLQAIRVGSMGIGAIPCEVFCEIGLEIKAKSPLKPTCIIELANGYNGYLPTPQQHEWGGYETWRARSSYLEVRASDKITATLLELLREVSQERPSSEQ